MLTAPQAFKEGFAVDWFHSAILDVVVAATGQGSQLGHFGEIYRHRVFHQFVGQTPALRG